MIKSPCAAPTLFLLLAYATSTTAGGPDRLQGEPAPALQLNDLFGDTHRLEEYRDNVVLVNFWGTWCPPCLEEMPAMQRLKEAMADRPFAILAVNVKQPRADVLRYVEALGIDFTVLLDATGKAKTRWRVKIFPTTFLIDPRGRIRDAVYGALEWDGEEALSSIEALMPNRDRGQE